MGWNNSSDPATVVVVVLALSRLGLEVANGPAHLIGIWAVFGPARVGLFFIEFGFGPAHILKH